jgi:hypothetical protein
MKQNKQDLDSIIEKATRSIRDEQLDPTVLDRTADRVWARVRQAAAENSSSLNSYSEGVNTMNASNNDQTIRGCDDFRSLIPAYLDGKISNARKLLLEDHSNECVPCRKELKTQRAAAAAKTVTYVAPQHIQRKSRKALAASSGRWSTSSIARYSIAAALILAVGVAGLFMYERLDLSGTTLAATIDDAHGQVYVVSDLETRELGAGGQLQKGERVRTAKDSNAVLRLADGSTIEMRERSEFSVTENMRGVTIRLDRGDVIVEAAKQHNGRLYVQTPDSLVSVKGTIFAVESGTKGSRVSVVEGEVKVDHAGKQETLLPGDQATTNASLDKTPVQQNVAWSRNASKYATLVSELAKLRSDLNQKVARPGVRHSSRFLDLVPENTVFYAALPNLSETLAQSQRIMQERIKQNPALAEWWKSEKGADVDQKTMARIHEFGSYLGDEIVVTAEMSAKGEPTGVLVLGEVKDPTSFRSYLNGQIAQLSAGAKDMPNIRIIDDPLTANVAPKAAVPSRGEKNAVSKEELYVWIQKDIFAASPQIESLRGFAAKQKEPGTNSFASSSFRQRIGDVYKDGAGLIVAADVERLLAQALATTKTPDEQRNVQGLKQLGVMNLRHFVAEQKESNGKTLSQAALTFSEADRGIASWLAAPGSMGALDFISSNANVAAAFVVKEPALLVDDLLGFLETVQPDLKKQMEEMEKSQGFSLRNDFAAPLGGEFAFAIDGPLLPTPSWKLIMEVYDQAKLQNTFERAIEKLNQFAVLHGKGKLSIEGTASGDRTFYAVKSADVGLEVHYTFANGYLIAAPSRAMLEQAISNREAGNTLVHSSRFMSSMPQDGNANFSAIFYHDLAPLMGNLAEKMKSRGGDAAGKEKQMLGSIDPNGPPTLAYVYAQSDRITVAANTEGGAFGLSPASLIGLPNSFEMQHILMNAMGDKDVQKKSD